MFVYFILLALCSCKKQNEIVTLPSDKLYILEYTYSFPEEGDDPWELKCHVIGFCELDNNFNLKYARIANCSYDYYYNTQSTVTDSMKNKISNVLLKYSTDTTFLYQEEQGARIYDGNRYRFIMQKYNQKDIIIKFEPRYLPEDLEFVYLYLYGNRGNTVPKYKYKYNELFEMFETQVQNL